MARYMYIFLLLAFIITAMFASSKGNLELYVRSDNDNATCPPTTIPTNCRLFSEYARDEYLILDSNTSFVFLPGQHFLDTAANFSNLVHLSFRPSKVEHSTSVIVDQGGSIFLRFIDVIEIAFMEIQSHETTTGGEIPNVFQVVGASDVNIAYCNFTNNAARALLITDSYITLVGNQVLYSKRSWLGLDYSTATLIDNVISHNNLENEAWPGRAVIHAANSSLSTSGTNIFSLTGNSYTVVAGIISAVDSTVVIAGVTFFLENTGFDAGVFYSLNSTLVLDGNANFHGNMGQFAGVVSGSSYSMVLCGNTVFRDNNALFAGVIEGSDYMVMVNGNATFSANTAIRTGVIEGTNYTLMVDGNATFSENDGKLTAGVFAGDDHTILISGITTFLRNTAGSAGVIDGKNYSMTINGNTCFSDNFAFTSGVIGGTGYYVAVYGKASFFGNSGGVAGVIYGRHSTVILDGNATFLDNGGIYGGVVFGPDLRMILTKYAAFEGNNGVFGGVFACLNSQYIFSGKVTFVDNRARYGGALYSVSSTITFQNGSNVTFYENFAIQDGGGLYMSSSSRLIFSSCVTVSVSFVQNAARNKGGAIFIQDSNTLIYCFALQQQQGDQLAVQDCAFQVDDYSGTATYDAKMYFTDNTAEAGSAIYGGAIDTCFLETDSDRMVYGQQLFDSIADFTEDADRKNDTFDSRISSDPFILCSCVGSEPNCANSSIHYTVYPGATIQVTVIALGQRNGSVPATIVSMENDFTFSIEQLEKTQAIPNTCSNVSYTIHAEAGMTSLSLYADGFCVSEGVGLVVEIKVLSCPPGFVLADNPLACVCHPSLVGYTNSCNLQDGTILRAQGSEFWVGYDVENDGIILYSSCPFDYCIMETVNFQVEDSNAQCNNDRSGLLCGECSEGLSSLLGSDSCEKCPDDYLSLLLFFAAAGVILVAFLLLLNLTVAIGTINGLVFYANIVAANEALVFPSKSNIYLDILKVFISWINLDFGIKSCFYDGMDEYAKTWLQYGFPVYIWALIGLVFLVSHLSGRAARIFGKNPVAVLATLILLSYSKVIRTVIDAFSSATLDYSKRESKTVWLNDGNVPFLDTSDGRHLGLFVASLLVLLVLFIPYTLILLTSQWLQIKSHWKVLSWLNKPQLSSFLDAYNAPYKPKHRYWTGLLLLVRLALLVTTARTLSTNPSVIFLVVQVFVLVLLVWVSFFGGVYRKWYLNVLEGFFFVNLGLLSASIHHIQYSSSTMELSSSETQTSSIAITSTLVTAVLATFLGIVAFHLFLKVKDWKVFKRIMSYMTCTGEPNSVVELKEPVMNSDAGVSTSYITLREPLLDDT